MPNRNRVRHLKSRKLFYLGAVPFLFANGFFVANMTRYAELRRFADRPELAMVSALFVLVFALPSFVALVRWLGARRGGATLLALGVFAVAIETIAVQTGFPYGRFSYGAKIGGKVAGVVPWTVPFAWTPLLLAAYCLARRWMNDARTTILCSALWVAALDGVLDPGAVAQGFWKYDCPGAYYGVPLSNFAGWLLSGALGAGILLAMTRHAGQERRESGAPPSGLLGSAFLILVFWTSVCAWSALWLPALLGLVLLAVIARVFFSNEPQSPRHHAADSSVFDV